MENRGAGKGGAGSKKKRKKGELNFSPKPKRIEFSVSKFLVHHETFYRARGSQTRAGCFGSEGAQQFEKKSLTHFHSEINSLGVD
jgi:hypothetical protein